MGSGRPAAVERDQLQPGGGGPLRAIRLPADTSSSWVSGTSSRLRRVKNPNGYRHRPKSQYDIALPVKNRARRPATKAISGLCLERTSCDRAADAAE